MEKIVGEKSVYDLVIKGCTGYWKRLESKIAEGWPDLVGVTRQGGTTAFVEAKAASLWPARGGAIDLDLRADQAIFAKKWWNNNGLSFILVRVQNEFYLVTGNYAHEVREGWNRDQFRRLSVPLGLMGSKGFKPIADSLEMIIDAFATVRAPGDPNHPAHAVYMNELYGTLGKLCRKEP